MELFKRKQQEKVLQIGVEKISPNPNQPRSNFQEIESLSKSIQQLGLLQPLTVRKIEDGYELIAGERRFRACQLLGFTQVPCLVKEVTSEDSALLALVENIQRENLDYMEEARALSHILQKFKLSQEELSKQLGKSQSAIANMLRLLRLSQPVIDKLRQGNCTQRHARALLKLPEEKQRLEILEKVIAKGLNVQQTEELIDEYLTEPITKKGKQVFIVKDVRLFLNSINKAVDIMKAAGIPMDYHKEDSEEDILLTIKVPRNPNKQKSAPPKVTSEKSTPDTQKAPLIPPTPPTSPTPIEPRNDNTPIVLEADKSKQEAIPSLL